MSAPITAETIMKFRPFNKIEYQFLKWEKKEDKRASIEVVINGVTIPIIFHRGGHYTHPKTGREYMEHSINVISDDKQKLLALFNEFFEKAVHDPKVYSCRGHNALKCFSLSFFSAKWEMEDALRKKDRLMSPACVIL